MRIVEVTEKNQDRILNFLRTDVIRHVFALYDLQCKREHTKMYAAFNAEGSLEAYILIYTAMKFPSVVLKGKATIIEKLLEYAPKTPMIIHAEQHLLETVKKRFPRGKIYTESWMLVKRSEARFFDSNLVRRLKVEDADKLLQLLSSREERIPDKKERYEKWIREMPIYGVFIDGKLVSYAGSFLQLPQVWMIGGVYTHPAHRSKGYATMAVSAVTKHALNLAEAAALFVRSNNYPAIRVYEKIRYKKIGEKFWIDVDTGLKP